MDFMSGTDEYSGYHKQSEVNMDRPDFARKIEFRTSAVRLLCLVLVIYVAGAVAATAQNGALAYLPDESSLAGWETLGDPQTAEGDDLFLLINGGAEIYNEYGFARAVIHSYTKGDKSVNLELYEMEDAAGAYGAYSFKTGRGGESIDIGSEAIFEEYYLNFWKGNVVVTLIGFDSDAETRDAILTLARLVEANIPTVSARPAIMNILPAESSRGESVHLTYLEGNLGLLNRYRFGSGDVLGFTHAVVGDYGDYLVFLFPYASAFEAGEWFQRAVQSLTSNQRYTNHLVRPDAFSADDPDNRHVLLKLVEAHIVVYVGDDRDEASNVVEDVLQRVAASTEEGARM
jgi:hypothetical protein